MNRPAFTRERFVQMSGNLTKVVHVCLETTPLLRRGQCQGTGERTVPFLAIARVTSANPRLSIETIGFHPEPQYTRTDFGDMGLTFTFGLVRNNVSVAFC